MYTIHSRAVPLYSPCLLKLLFSAIDPLHDDVSHQNNPRRALHCRSFQGSLIVCWRANRGEGGSFVSWSWYKRVCLPEKVVDKNTRKALRRWISCRGLTISGDSFDICTKVTLSCLGDYVSVTVWYDETVTITNYITGRTFARFLQNKIFKVSTKSD